MNMGLWQIISTTDLMSKLVLLVLLGMSILCWAFALYKRMVIGAKLKQLKQAVTLLQNTKGIDDFLARVSVMQGAFSGEIISSFLKDFKRVQGLADWDVLALSVQQRAEEAISHEESMLPLLSTSAQAAPLIGLFGTVWGLIHAFMGIAEQRSADISAVAPGIAEALITTMGGLVVAIPALVLLSYLQGNIKRLESAIIEVADSCLWIMKSILSSQEVVMKTAAATFERPIHEKSQQEKQG